jgi:hypothetical protein
MTPFLLIILSIAIVLVAVLIFTTQRLEKQKIAALRQVEEANREKNEEIESARNEARIAVANAEKVLGRKLAELESHHDTVRAHYETEARKAGELLSQQLDEALGDLRKLRPFEKLKNEEEEVRQVLADALVKATSLQNEANSVLESARSAAVEERIAAQRRGKEIREQAEALLSQATRDAGRLVAEADKRSQEIGGDAYLALRDKQMLEQAVKAIQNVVEGYGDRYVIPTHSLLDDLAADFGHTSAGESLKAAREQTRRMVVQGEAAECDYAEASRRATATRFVVDAFNGRVDAILSRVKHHNHGTLEQEIRDAFSLVNLNGQAFRNARILPLYLEARVAELKWAVITQELRLKEREEQRQIQERIREEEKARREYERAMQEAAKEEDLIKQAMETARAEAAHATAAERVKFEAQLAQLGQKLADAEAKSQRALSMAQQTRSGHVYIISNIGAFGEEVFKIGMTRRLEPLDRVKELGDASVPFAFDVHGMIYSDDAPTLERLLHEQFDDLRINKVNYRKEFFRVPLDRVRAFAEEKGFQTTFTMVAEARDYRETQALEKMTPDERQKYHLNLQEDMADE